MTREFNARGKIQKTEFVGMIEFHELTLETYTAALRLPCPLRYICVFHTAFSSPFFSSLFSSSSLREAQRWD